jgi:hypothetical protein
VHWGVIVDAYQSDGKLSSKTVESHEKGDPIISGRFNCVTNGPQIHSGEESEKEVAGCDR